MSIVTIQHELRPLSESTAAIIEIQTYLLLSEKTVEIKLEKTPFLPVHTKHQKEIVPDETLLFQYSALGFNSHKIHLDRDYARNVEGLPDLVVNGGLTTLLLTEFLRTDLGLKLADLKVKHITPLYCNRKMTIGTEGGERTLQLKIWDDNNIVAVEAEAKVIGYAI
ncbi:MAG: hypothetical protein SF052_11140 [Bacteroidia bacterium]|nr:hypothetical protein [Bacteroidia bacterium]